jgi:hypothetical protein
MKDAVARAIPAAIWGVMVVAGVLVIVYSGKSPQDPVGVVIGQKLPANFYFLPGDKALRTSAGRYVASLSGAAVGTVLGSHQLTDRAAIPLFHEPKFLLSAPVAVETIRAGLNAGSPARICGSGATDYGEGTILFVACDDGLRTFCAAVVQPKDVPSVERIGSTAKDPVALKDVHVAEVCK